MSLDEGVPLEQIEDTVSIEATLDQVYTHLKTIEGLGITDAVTTDWRGGRALVLVAPDAGGGSTVTMIADAPAGSEAGTEMRVRMRQELERVAATLESQHGAAGHGPVAAHLGLADEQVQFGERLARLGVVGLGGAPRQ